MADKDYSQLSSATTAADTDLLALYPTGGPLKKVTWATLRNLFITALGGTYLTAANSLSDIASASQGRANLGLGSVATLATTAVLQSANNLSEIPNAGTARTNIGAAAASGAQLSNGVSILSGSVNQAPQAVASTSFDLSLTDYFTKSISSNTTFTFANAVAAKAQSFAVQLTISSSAVPTWPASVKWPGGSAPTLGNGTHIVGFVTFDGTNYTGVLAASAVA